MNMGKENREEKEFDPLEREIQKNWPQGSLNVEYEPDNIPQNSNVKIREMMAAHYAKYETKNVDMLVSKIKQYVANSAAPIGHVCLNEEATNMDDHRLLVLNVFLEGTFVQKHIAQKHVDEHILNQNQIAANS